MAKREKPHEIYVDIIAYDQQHRPVLLVEVKARSRKRHAENPRSELEAHPENEKNEQFFMLVDSDQIDLCRSVGKFSPPRYGRRNVSRLEPIARFDSKDVFRRYDPEFGKKPIQEVYLTGLTEGWLRDLAYHWKYEEPPGTDRFKELGLLDRLRDGTTIMEEVARARPVVP